MWDLNRRLDFGIAKILGMWVQKGYTLGKCKNVN